MDITDPLEPDRCARLLTALAAPDRLKIVRYLRDGPKNVTQVAEHLDTAPVNVAHHIGVLREAGIVRSRKKGRFVFHELAGGLIQSEEGGSPKEYLDLGCCRLEMPVPEAVE